ncbi:MAG: SBBP repeat-containing protein [Candidatus Heimdallarchaeota archaeon]|nr:SBBP repeat-containing protein [Candidatus Heimdallarchaeota archaeon]MCK5048186.1 SBBP repeat-containing protein [Candidatus Heimdallarchaeota archaeon]
MNVRRSFLLIGFLYIEFLIVFSGTNASVLHGAKERLNDDAFVMQSDLKLNQEEYLDIIRWSTLLGGTESDYGYSVAVDSFDCAIITGDTKSSDFPVKSVFDVN